MSRKINVKVFGYICPPEVDVYADLPEFEPEFKVEVNYYKGSRATFNDPGEDDSWEVNSLDYADGTPMTRAEELFWIDNLDDAIADKVYDAL